MKRIQLIAFLSIGLVSSVFAGTELADLEKKAMQRDYQAQRNLAYVHQTGELDAPVDLFKACVWRTVIIHSGHEEVDRSDASNFDRACGSLTASQRVAAVAKGEALAQKLYRR